jgi:hypothetical protein
MSNPFSTNQQLKLIPLICAEGCYEHYIKCGHSSISGEQLGFTKRLTKL